MTNPRENYTAAQLQASAILDEAREGKLFAQERITWALEELGDL